MKYLEILKECLLNYEVEICFFMEDEKTFAATIDGEYISSDTFEDLIIEIQNILLV